MPVRQALSFAVNENVSLGMYVTEKCKETKTVFEQYSATRATCLRNAKVLRDAGQKSKSDTWTLLAQVRKFTSISTSVDLWFNADN